MLWASISCWKKLQSKMFDKYNNFETHCNKSEKRLHTSREALNWLLDENDASLTLTTLGTAPAALGKKVNLQLATAWPKISILSVNFSLCSSGTSAGVEQTGFQSSVSEHGVELWAFSVRAPVVSSKFWGQNSGVKTWKTRFSPRQLQYATLGQLHEILHGGYFYT